ncbi:MAG: hypothetical protein AAF411_13995 [Myxococcota bacterium]
MSGQTRPDDYETPKGRYIFFALAFAALIAIGIWTVMVPALEDAPDEETPSSAVENSEGDTPAEP